MLTFTEHIKHISQLSDKALIHAQGEKYPLARDDIVRISIHSQEALEQLDEMDSMKRHGKE